jgi:hypothetical protein
MEKSPEEENICSPQSSMSVLVCQCTLKNIEKTSQIEYTYLCNPILVFNAT